MAEVIIKKPMKFKHERHPIRWLQNFCASNKTLSGERISLSFSRYNYKPQTLADQRDTFQLCSDELSDVFLDQEFNALQPKQDLALNSRVTLAGKVYHIPMIDFAKRDMEKHQFRPLRELCEYWGIDLTIFDSGRSYHGYGNCLLNEEDWVKFMGSLLLVNKPGEVTIIDNRWIGHRILGGYSALRWSLNSSQYKKYPTSVGVLSSKFGFTKTFSSIEVIFNRS